MNDYYSIYVAKSPITGLFLTRVLNFLHGNQSWMEFANPTTNEVANQLLAADARRSLWTDDINNADVWDEYNINKFKQYLPEVEFVKVNLSTVPL